MGHLASFVSPPQTLQPSCWPLSLPFLLPLPSPSSYPHNQPPSHPTGIQSPPSQPFSPFSLLSAHFRLPSPFLLTPFSSLGTLSAARISPQLSRPINPLELERRSPQSIAFFLSQNDPPLSSYL
ncbi:hypothetical protein IE53DRAFT_208826 [Violaceomyces palustris]|uniref:Uncharacterized protein n=1 Tax=Violaceomyces palustris TaxID=1673888 RepID=A0ACD0P555_9BASI|nr:hypothetical protein IE53DRAFT_208826 [Violaceomyces palustris]